MEKLHPSSKVIIVGNGIAGITAARTIRKKSNCSITVISSESKYFFSRTALMYVYMGHMRFLDTQPYETDFWSQNKIDLMHDTVTLFDFENQRIFTEKEGHLPYDALILATGSQPNIPDWSGINLKGVQCLYSKQDLEKLEEISPAVKKAVIVGGGLIGVEWVEMLVSRGIETHFLIREKSFWSQVLPAEDSAFVSLELSRHKDVHLHYSSEIEKIDGDDKVNAVTLKDERQIPCDLVGVSIGVSPNIQVFKSTNLDCEKGILVDEFLRTNIENVYAIGDCAQIRNPQSGRKSVEAVWYSARKMGETLGETLTGHPTAYNPGVWFNSAKFFDLEYQTYGQMPSQTPEDEENLVFEHKKCLIHLRYKRESLNFTGINVFGTRVRHALLDAWLSHSTSIKTVLENWKNVEFDPEFSKSNAKGLIHLWNDSHTDQKIELTKRHGWRNLIKSKHE